MREVEMTRVTKEDSEMKEFKRENKIMGIDRGQETGIFLSETVTSVKNQGIK